MTIQSIQFQQETRASIQSLTNQMGQLATQLNQIQVPQPVAAPAPKPIKLNSTHEKEDEIVAQKRKLPNKNFHAGGPSSSSYDLPQPLIPLPVPPRAIPNKKMEEAEKEILETFRKVEVSIPLQDAIKHIPRYAKFLKELCTYKRNLKGNERISMGRNVSALMCKSVGGTRIWLPDLRVMALTFFRFCTVCEGNMSEFWD